MMPSVFSRVTHGFVSIRNLQHSESDQQGHNALLESATVIKHQLFRIGTNPAASRLSEEREAHPQAAISR